MCLLLTLVSCRPSSKSVTTTSSPDSVAVLRHAKGFEIAYYPHCKKVTVFNPWSKQRDVLQEYWLYRDKRPALPDGSVAVQIPLKSLAITSCTHVEFLRLLSPSLSLIKGACNTNLIYNDSLRTAAKDGRLVDLGDSFQLNVEKVLSLKVEAIMVSGHNQFDERAAFLMRAGLPVIFNNEWMESDLLGRAEWIRFVAAFLDCEKLANQLFLETERNYLSLKQLVKENKQADLQVLPGEDFRGTWYLPGGRSYIAQLLRDAGGRYFYENDSTTGSLSASIESVLRDMHQADIWVGVDARSLKDLLAKDARYGLFRPWKNKQVYAYNLRTTPEGGNDFWESAVAHPDWLLADFVRLLQPGLLDDHEWVYLRRLE